MSVAKNTWDKKKYGFNENVIYCTDSEDYLTDFSHNTNVWRHPLT